ncbi:helix-turn-helix domain-containing protein [Cohaesibacter celericrescens]|uniref:HTH luxR-type domain-containing protein n=1 Tax=Cohaesibacter celericrescens TaxID=2067669 RepID=A0A2N5XPJ3_9HYPH|nr:helix-turn-helix transcriptional regulator [Cohaesibacter celericrescens]PLW76348.1 hypothetical protein C0081_15810 [Cohaesibacter celericrescens]
MTSPTQTQKQLELIEACLNHRGTETFFKPYLELIDSLSACQVVIMSYGEGKPVSLICRNFNNTLTATRMMMLYVSQYYKTDTLRDEILAMPKGAMSLRTFDDILKPLPLESKNDLTSIFQSAHIEDKDAVLVVGSRHRLIINFYYTQKEDRQEKPSLISILGWLALLHYETDTQQTNPSVLDPLSDREKQVCHGILQGKKAEVIAADMDVAPSTVVTYRRRAYEKLGISSRASLFEIYNDGPI